MSIIAITIQRGQDLDAPVDQRFGRAPFFLVVNTDSGEVVDTVRNEAAEAAHAAGPAAARTVAQQRVEAVASGRFGPKAADALVTLGIRMYEFGTAATARDVLEGFRNDKLQAVGSR